MEIEGWAYMKVYLLLTFALVGLTVHAAPSNSPDWEEFTRYCTRHRLGAKEFRLANAPETGVKDYFPVSALEAGQTRFSFARFRASLKKALKSEPGAYIDKKEDRWVLPHQNHTALYAAHRYTTGIYYRGKIYIVDGHHRALISTYLGAGTIPVKIAGDWSDKFSPPEFFAELEKMGLTHLRNFRGQPMERRDLCDLIDDPNLHLAKMLVARVDIELRGNRMEIRKISGSDMPNAIKINQDIPFFEFEIADALRRAGVDFDPRRKAIDITLPEREEYLKILRAAARRSTSRLDEVLLLDHATPVAELDIRALVFNHLQRDACDAQLRGTKSEIQ